MKKHPATSNASRRSRGTDRITGELNSTRGEGARPSETELEFPGPQRGWSQLQEVGGAGDETDLDQPLDRLADRRRALRRVLDRGQLAAHRGFGELSRVGVDQGGEDHRFDVSLTTFGAQGQT